MMCLALRATCVVALLTGLCSSGMTVAAAPLLGFIADFERFDDARGLRGDQVIFPEIVGDIEGTADTEGHRGRALLCRPVAEEHLRYPGTLLNPVEGTVILWVNCELDALPPLHVNLWHINSGRWDEGSLYVDITPGQSRSLRFASYPSAGGIGEGRIASVALADSPWRDGDWNRVTAVWSELSADGPGGKLSLYLNGELVAETDPAAHSLAFPEEAPLLIGVNYTGLIDDLVILPVSILRDEQARLQTLRMLEGANDTLP